MDDSAAGPIRTVLLAAGAVVALVLVVGGVLWTSDYGLEATVVDKECGGVLAPAASSEVTVKTKPFGIEHTVKDFPDAQCQGLRTGSDGNFVRYHLRSGHTILFEREGGACIWDSEKGLGC